jgi:hypothetical protein
MTDHHGHVVVFLVTCSIVNTNDILKKLHFSNALYTQNWKETEIDFTMLKINRKFKKPVDYQFL